MATTDLTVAVTADKTSVAPGQTLGITITVTNPSSVSQDLDFASGCQTKYQFLNAAGQVVGSQLLICTQATSRRTLQAGGSFAESHQWTRSPLESPQLPPGAYQLRGVLLTHDAVVSSPVPIAVP